MGVQDSLSFIAEVARFAAMGQSQYATTAIAAIRTLKLATTTPPQSDVDMTRYPALVCVRLATGVRHHPARHLR